MAANDKAMQKQNTTDLSKTSSTASQSMLAVQLHLMEANYNCDIPPELVAEFDRKFSCEPAEAIEWACIVHRDQSTFPPTVAHISRLIKEWKRGQQEQKALRADLDEKYAIKEGRKQGLVPALGEVLKQVAEVALKMKMPDHERRWREHEARNSNRPSVIPVIAQHMTPEQIAARREKERAEIERYRRHNEPTDEGAEKVEGE